MSRHPFSRRNRRRMRKGYVKYKPRYEMRFCKSAGKRLLRVRWGPRNPDNPSERKRHRPYDPFTPIGRRASWDPRRSPVPKRKPRPPRHPWLNANSD